MSESLSQTARDTCYDKVRSVTTGLRTRDDILTVGDANSTGREGDFTAVVSGEVSTIAGLGSTGPIADGGNIGSTFNDKIADSGTASGTTEGTFGDTMFGGASLRLSDADGLLSLSIT